MSKMASKILIYTAKQVNHNRPRGSHLKGRKDGNVGLSDFSFEMVGILCKSCGYRRFGRLGNKKNDVPNLSKSFEAFLCLSHVWGYQ